MKKTIILFLLMTNILFGNNYTVNDCNEGGTHQMAVCYMNKYNHLDKLIQKKLEDVKQTHYDFKLGNETQKNWQEYTQKWCKGRIRLNGESGQMIYYHCLIQHATLRLEQLNIYYCNENGCGSKE